ncbi:MAG: anhydro-N-acetylmuramic acid kinase [Ignavibacteria bacterium]|nr:anhydro-N-acetylmuramic acid kinase [Ignavibacteria bacterium]
MKSLLSTNLESLLASAQKSERRIIGLMSGTSLDGLDIALCRISGSGSDTKVVVERFTTVAYSDEVKNAIRSVFAKEQVDFQHLTLLNAWIGRLHGQMVADALRSWGIDPDEVDAVASHGQTVMHAPKSLHKKYDFPEEGFPNATLQIGDGDHVAVASGIITLSDFRQKHIALGGEGAPLAVYGDYFMFSTSTENRIMLNLGGIANFTYLPKTQDAGAIFTTDTGPGNTMLDAYARRMYGKAFDTNGSIALAGRFSERLLKALKNHPFFDAPFPKTTGPELFNMAYLDGVAADHRVFLSAMPAEDVMATLVRFSAETVADAITQTFDSQESFSVYLSGGGAHNPALVAALQELLPGAVRFGTTDDLGIAGDAKEAVLFAVLANETLCGGRTGFGDRQGVPTVSMGKISFPE